MKANLMRILRGAKYYVWNYIICWIPSYFLRYIILTKIYSGKVSAKASLHIGIKIFGHAENLRIEEGTVINPECRLDARGGLEIGKNVSISREVFILSLTHDYNSSDFALQKGPIKIGDDCWLGIRAIIMPGVNLGKGVVIGAGAIVTRNMPDYAIAVGVPAKVVGYRKKQNYSPVYYKPFLGGET